MEPEISFPHSQVPATSARSIQSMPLHSTTWRSIVLFSTHLRLGLPSGLFPSGFPTKTMYAPISGYMPHPSHFS